MPITQQFVDPLKQELVSIGGQIDKLTNRREILEEVLLEYRDEVKMAKPHVVKQGKSKVMPMAARHGKSKMKIKKTQTAVTNNEEKDLSTMEMARKVLEQHPGQERSLSDIKEGISMFFAIEPAKTIDQMLYKAARLGTTLYRNNNGEYGLVAWNQNGKSDAVALA